MREVVKKVVTRECNQLEIVENAAQVEIPQTGYVISLGGDDRVSKRALLNDLRLYLARPEKKKRVFAFA